MQQEQGSIRALLGKLIKNRHLAASMRRVMVMSMWEEVVGKPAARKSWPEKVADGVLYVGVSSHTWAEELHLLKPRILNRYRQLLGRSVLSDVEFRVGRRKASKVEDSAPAGQPLHPLRGEELPTQPLPDQLLDGVANHEVRDILAPIFTRLRAERAWKREHGWARCAACRRIFHGIACPECGGEPEE